jgi:hypothetical protein
MEGAFVEEIGQVSARHAGRDARNALKVDGRSQLESLGVHGQDGLATTQVGQIDKDLAIEATRTQ